MLFYKIDVLRALKDAGYNTGRLKREKILPGSTVDKLHDGTITDHRSLDRLCALLNCQPGDLIGYKPDPKN